MKSLKKYNRDVALATIVSCDPKLNLMVLKLEINYGRCMSIWHLRKLTIWYGVAKTAILSVMLKKQRLHGLQPLYVTNLASVSTCIMSMHCVLTIHFIFLFVDSEDKWMSIWVCGEYTSMFQFMVTMMDAFSFS